MIKRTHVSVMPVPQANATHASHLRLCRRQNVRMRTI
jgi:hypothetical protein